MTDTLSAFYSGSCFNTRSKMTQNGLKNVFEKCNKDKTDLDPPECILKKFLRHCQNHKLNDKPTLIDFVIF